MSSLEERSLSKFSKGDEGKKSRKSIKTEEYALEEKLYAPKHVEDGEEEKDGGVREERVDTNSEGRKIGEKVAEKLWETAWAICSERFYFAHAVPIITCELRNTWLRIIESTYMDEYVSMDGPPADLFKADEPPPILMYDSPSTDLILGSRPAPITVDVGGGGEPHEPERRKHSEKKRSSAKSKGSFLRKISGKYKKNKKGSKERRTIDKSTSSEMYLSRGSGSEYLRTPNLSRSGTDEEVETEVTPVKPIRKCPPKRPPWEIVYKSTKKFSDDLSPKMSLDFTSFKASSDMDVNSLSATNNLQSCKNTATYSKLCPTLVICKAKHNPKNEEDPEDVKNIAKKTIEGGNEVERVASEKGLDISKTESKKSVTTEKGSNTRVEENQKPSQ